MSSKNWMAVASAEHVRQGRLLGFMQVCHGKEAPLKRLKPYDWIIYYSPTLKLHDKNKLQAFTAIGQIKDSPFYQVDMGNGFRPFRRDVQWYEAKEVSIAPLLKQLHLTKDKKNWGYVFRYGLFSIQEEDRHLISTAMQLQQGGK